VAAAWDGACGTGWHEAKGSHARGHYPLAAMRRLHAVVLPLTLLLATTALAGCTPSTQSTSAGDFQGAERDAAQVIDDLKGTRDPEEICSRILTDDFAKSLEADGHDCVDEVRATIRDTADTDMDVRDVTISGSTARAEVRQDGKTATFELERDGSSWRISSFGEPAAG
jgi:hypothetical protein